MAQLQGYAVIVETLHDVPHEPARIRHQLGNDPDFGALKGHPASHNEPDVAGAQYHRLFADHIALNVHESLCRSGSVYPRRTVPRDSESASRSLAAAHGEHYRSGLYRDRALFAVYVRYLTFGRYIRHYGAHFDGDVPLANLIYEPLSVFRTRKLLFERVQTKTVVYALVEDTAEDAVSFKYEQVVNACLFRCKRRSHSRRTAADDYQAVFIHRPASCLLRRFF